MRRKKKVEREERSGGCRWEGREGRGKRRRGVRVNGRVEDVGG